MRAGGQASRRRGAKGWWKGGLCVDVGMCVEEGWKVHMEKTTLFLGPAYPMIDSELSGEKETKTPTERAVFTVKTHWDRQAIRISLRVMHSPFQKKKKKCFYHFLAKRTPFSDFFR